MCSDVKEGVALSFHALANLRRKLQIEIFSLSGPCGSRLWWAYRYPSILGFPCSSLLYLLEISMIFLLKTAHPSFILKWILVSFFPNWNCLIKDHLTMFADYRVPQVLSHEGVLIYSSELKSRLERKEEIPFGDQDECEIRAASILSVHLIVNQVNEKIPLEKDTGDAGLRLNAPLIDFYLWRKRRQQADLYGKTPFHRTRSIFYWLRKRRDWTKNIFCFYQ